MKSFMICLLAILVGASGYAQKGKQNSDTTLRTYLTYSCTTHPEFVSNTPAKCPLCHNQMSLTPKEKMKSAGVKLYTCTMHSDVLCTKPGKCPECGMDMVEFKPIMKNKDR